MEIDRRRKWPMGAAYWQEENMVDYGEYLFLENFITGLLLLYLTARLVMPGRGPVQITPHQSLRPRKNGRLDAIGHEVRQSSDRQMAATDHEVRLWRLLAGAAVCGGCGFLIFLPVQPAVGILVRGLLSAAVTAAALGRHQLVRKTAVFLVLTFLTGGTAMAVLLWMQEPAIAGNGAMYVGAGTYGRLLAAGVPAAALGLWLVKLVKTQRMRVRTTGTVEIEIEGRICRLQAMVDSGNCLREPITGRPVILIDEKGRRDCGFCAEKEPRRLAVIPYEAVGVKKGLLQGVRLDGMRFGGRELGSVVLAAYEGNFPGFEVLLHQDILEEGLFEDGQNAV